MDPNLEELFQSIISGRLNNIINKKIVELLKQYVLTATGISSTVLPDRLLDLEREGLISKKI